MRVDVRPEMLTWARERAGLSPDDLVTRFPRLPEWESGAVQPTLKQLQALAKATHAPFGYLLLDEPPEEEVPLPDFRTLADREVTRVSPDLLDTIYLCEQRQEWFRTYAQREQLPAASIYDLANLEDEPRAVAGEVRRALGYEVHDRAALGSWAEAFRLLSERIEAAGALVMVNGIVGNNTHRVLDPREFRGFTLADPIASTIFINGADTKAAQIFTLAHEVGHVVLGGSALGNATMTSSDLPAVERWCNTFAAELLVPAAVLRNDVPPSADPRTHLQPLARRYRVSTLVVLRRFRDLEIIDQPTFRALYDAELEVAMTARTQQTGGNFYATTPVRSSKRFTTAVLTSTLEGGTLHREAFALLGFKSARTFDQLVERMGIG